MPQNNINIQSLNNMDPSELAKLNNLFLEEGREIIDKDSMINSSTYSEEAIKQYSEEILDNSTFETGYQMPTVNLENSISEEAMKKLQKENLERKRKDPKVKEDVLIWMLKQQQENFYQTHHYYMRNHDLKVLFKKLSRLYDKGRFNKYIDQKSSLN